MAETTGDEAGETGAADLDAVLAPVRTLFPEVGHEALLRGITGVARYAAEQQRVLDGLLARLDSAVRGVTPEEPQPALGDRLLASALNGAGLTERDARWYYDFQHSLFELPQLLARSMKGLAEPAPAGIFHLSLAKQEPLEHLNGLALPELPAVLALRAASEATVEEHRRALDTFLGELDAHGLTELDPGHWRRVHLAFDPDTFDGPGDTYGYSRGTVLDLEGGAFLLFPDDWYQFVREYGPHEVKGKHYGAAYHDPSGRFQVPAPTPWCPRSRSCRSRHGHPAGSPPSAPSWPSAAPCPGAPRPPRSSPVSPASPRPRPAWCSPECRRSTTDASTYPPRP